MDLGFTEEQETLRDAARSFVRNETSPSLARSPEDPAVDAVWQKIVQLGWPAVAVDDAHGGSGMSIVELAILMEELGGSLTPGPFFATAGLYAPVLNAAPSSPARDALLRSLVEGGSGTLALAERQGSWAWDAMETTARPDGPDWLVSGTKHFVAEGGQAGEMLVAARAENGLGIFAIEGSRVSASPLLALDPSLRLATIQLDAVRVPAERVVAAPGHGEAVLESSLRESLVATAALTVGACAAILERTLEYTKTRKQFDQPIGTFQAVKHKLADMYVMVERARALVYFAALTICEDDPRQAIASAMAKAAAGDCQRKAVEDGLQLHGGMGYTWEFDLHLYLKRAAALESLLGTSREHRARIARGLGL